jgi:lambda family phage minor tail protein L
MSNLIATDAQKSELDDFVELFELVISSTNTLYFHNGTTVAGGLVQFRDYNTPYTIRSYAPIPIMLEGIELNADGAQNRPTLTIANVDPTLRNLLGVNVTNESMVGTRVIRRQTLKKYLVGGAGDSSPPVEFPIRSFVLDRISGENNLAVTFELASPFDVSGITLPNRVVIGKYCSWKYQNDGCIWKTNSTIYYPNAAGTPIAHKVYFTSKDAPIVPSTAISGAYSAGTSYTSGTLVSYSGGYYRRSLFGSGAGHTPSSTSSYWDVVRIYTVWSGSSVSYTANSSDPDASTYVEYSNTIWRCTKSHTSAGDKTPVTGSLYWIRGDNCGKQINSCKNRFQFVPQNKEVSNSTQSPSLDTNKQLPFGGFPGARRFR